MIDVAVGQQDFLRLDLELIDRRPDARQSPPGSTIAARLVAVHATIEQFCANGVTGTIVTLRGCMEASGERREALI